MEEEKKCFEDKVIEQTEKLICSMLENDLQTKDVDTLYELVDIHKDIKNEEYWKEKINMYRGSYGYRGYNDGSYGRRGVRGTGRGRYRGDDPVSEMQEHYEDYNDAQAEMYSGNYGAEGDMVKSVEGIMKNVYEIIEELSDAESPEVMHIIQKYAKKINEMK